MTEKLSAQEDSSLEPLSVARIGIIGYGNIGKLAAKTLRDMQPECLGAIADLIEKSAGNVLPDYATLLAQNEITAVIIATPPSTHFDIASAALNAGKDVLIEKPPTLTVQELQQLEQLAKDKDRV